ASRGKHRLHQRSKGIRLVLNPGRVISESRALSREGRTGRCAHTSRSWRSFWSAPVFSGAFRCGDRFCVRSNSTPHCKAKAAEKTAALHDAGARFAMPFYVGEGFLSQISETPPCPA